MNEEPISPQETEETGHYKLFRRLFFILCIVFFIAIALFLLYYNGKSIYENGL